MKYLLLGIVFGFFSCSDTKDSSALPSEEKEFVIYMPKVLEGQLGYPLAKLRESLLKNKVKLTVTNNYLAKSALGVSIRQGQKIAKAEANDGYQLSKKNDQYYLSSEHPRGLIYGLLDISEKLKTTPELSNLNEVDIQAHYPFRGIKFNLPWYSYRSGKNLSLHMETVRDLAYWQSFLDMMVENKFNTLTLWNLHPFMFMVQSDKYPKASPFSDTEMAEWQRFWRHLFGMAKDRGIDTYIVNWNIFVSEEFSQAYNTAEYAKSNGSGFWGEGETNPVIEDYTREMITKTIDTYENLTGIGLTLGERMGGMTSEQRKDWADRTIIAGLKAAKRKARLIYRAPLSAGKSSEGTTSVTTEKLTRDALENMGLDENVWVEFKFNWSHAHSSPKVSIVHGGMLTDTYWEPLSNQYKGVWTMRNEDFFVMRWAQPDFIRDFIKYNSQPYIGGAIIGSETYIPAKDYITKSQYKAWDFAFERQWLFYKVWGNLLFNRGTPDSVFAKALANKFGLDSGQQLLTAWKLASMNANRMASFFQGTWDATLYTEGFTTVGGRLIDINTLIAKPVLDKSYVSIPDFIGNNFSETQITPPQLAELAESESKLALNILAKLRGSVTSQALDVELTDIEFWAHYGFYFANKVRAGAALQSFRQGIDMNGQDKAVQLLQLCLEDWKKMVELAERYNNEVIPYQFDQAFSWRKHIKEVEYDIEIARGNILPKG